MRFHCGISFSWRTIKKFLFPFLLGLLGFLGFSLINENHKNILGLFSPLKVKAYQNYSTTYSFDIPNFDSNLQQRNCGNTNLKDFVHNFIEDYETNYSNYNYNLYIPRISDSYLTLIFYPKTYNNRNRFNFFIYDESTSQNPNNYVNRNYKHFSNSSHTFYKYTLYYTCDTNIYSSNSYLALLNFLNGNGYTYTSDNTGQFTSDSGYRFETNQVLTSLTSISNNESYNLDNFSNWFYYSSVAVNFNQDSCSSDNSLYCKSLHINNTNTTYNLSDTIPSFWDIKSTFPDEPIEDNDFIQYKKDLGTLYLNFLPSQINNLSYSMTFNTYDLSAYDYKRNIRYNWSCYGRVNHNDNYYTYEQFSYCDFEDTSDFVYDSNLLNIKFENFVFYDSNDNVITDFSNYDKLFIFIDFNYNNVNLNKTISNINFSTIANYYLSDTFRGSIYDNFNNLPLYFKLFVSSNKNSYFSIRNNIVPITDKYFLYKQFYNTSNLNPVGDITYLGTTFQNIYLNYDTSQALMIYQQISDVNSGIDTNNLDFIITKDIIISLTTLSNDNFYYYDNTGTIINNNISINYDDNPSNNYDVNSYFYSIEDFLYNFNAKIAYFHNVVQDFYDSIPTLLQTTIFVLFLLLLTYVIFNELRR